MSTHSKAAKRFVADAERMAWHDKALYAVREKRDRMMTPSGRNCGGCRPQSNATP